ncbi:formate dehydrogenase subunit gamma [Paenalcaligenes niemegkensis]|uniref:formate dehydrogenase subunit gamma n=1 Tax=Paenalcaligenes niemegkensis TaxID=2895469 RepID=UPI001EE9A594|nr:formate dehydrogenase subunit gamma [Paenalcaligenes niemegkensis]MCQ9617197.1 formate dehydrogenase subunit gamma [Paenalcaligenes niemegkensis]
MHIPSNAEQFGRANNDYEKTVNAALEQHAEKRGNLLPILHSIQDEIGYLPEAVVPLLAKALNLSRAEIHGVITFYAHFRQKPAGTHVLEVCMAEACQSMRSNELAQYARQKLSCDFHETSADGSVTLEPVYCLGLCAQSPAVMLNGKPYAKMSPERLDTLLASEGAK